jgi:hypothetical protein
MGVMLEEVDHVPAARVVLRVRQHSGTGARPRERHLQDVADGRLGPVGHQDQTIGEVKRLVDVMRDHHHRLARLLPDPQENVLQLEARQRVEL